MGQKNWFLILAFILFLGSFLQIFTNVLNTLAKRDLVDFTVYKEASEKFFKKENPYQHLYAKKISAGIPFNYPPSSLPFLSILNVFPAKQTQIVLTIFSFFSFWFSMWCVLKLSEINIKLPHFFLILTFLNQTFPVKFTLILGQINLIILGLVFGALYYKKYSVILFSIASLIKLFPLYVMSLFFVSKRYKIVFWVAVIFVLCTLFFGKLSFEYYSTILPSFSSLFFPSFYDQSIFAFLYRLTMNADLAKFIGIFSILILYSLTLFMFYERNKKNTLALLESFCMVLAISSIGNFFSWQHHLVFAYPFIFLLYLQTVGRKMYLFNKSFTLAFFVIIWLSLVFHFKNESSQLLSVPILASYQTITILVCIGMQFYLFYRNKDEYFKK